VASAKPPAQIMNVGAGEEISIAQLAVLVAEVVGYHGEIRWDRTKPDGMPRKLMDCGRMTTLGWTPRIGLREGLKDAYQWYVQHEAGRRGMASHQRSGVLLRFCLFSWFPPDGGEK
jgi:nucleoside-diphosphate-sugar epimerase